MRRGVGVAAFRDRQREKAAGAAVGSAMSADRAKHIEEQLATFKTHLEEFAAKHRNDINRDPEFRRAFAKMTKAIGVDPLASSKGFWGELLGVSDFYYEVGVQIVDICLSTRALNGGLISLTELTQRLTRMRGGAAAAAAAGGAGAAAPAAGAGRKHEAISVDDVQRTIAKLAVLGGGYRIITLAADGSSAAISGTPSAAAAAATPSDGGAGGEQYLLSVPVEMNVDQTILLARLSAMAARASPAAAAAPFACASSTPRALAAALGWAESRLQRCLGDLLKAGMAWLDTQGPGGAADPTYFFPAIRLVPSAAAAGGGAAAGGAGSA